MSEELKLLMEIRDLVAAQTRSFMALIGVLKTMSATQAEALREILEAVTAPVPESKIPDLLDRIITLIRDETGIVMKIEGATERIESKIGGP